MLGVKSGQTFGKPASLFVGTVVVLSAFWGPLGLVGIGAAANQSGNISSVSVTLADDGVKTDTDHDWTAVANSGLQENITHLKLDYSGHGVDLSRVSASDITITYNNTVAGTISGVSTDNGGQILNVSYSDEPSLDGDEKIKVSTANDTVANPPTAGTYTATLELYNGSQVASGSASYTAKSGTFSGGVVNTSDGTALEGASVSLSQGGAFVLNTMTDGTGSYSAEVAPGTYNFSVSRGDYESQYVFNVQVNDSEDKTQNFALSQTGILNGTVTNASSGNPITGATVTMQNTTTKSFYQNTTKSPGIYNETVASGTYDVTVSASGYVKNTTKVYVGPNGTVSTDFALTPASIITGTATDSDGNALSGMDVIAYNPETKKTDDFTRTGKNGDYSLSVGAGTYDVIAFDSDGTYEDAFEVGISIGTGETVSQDVTMTKAPPKGTLSGTVVGPDGNPVSKASVEAVDDTYTNFEQTTADGSGQFSLSLPEGTYEVTADAPGYAEGVSTNISVTGSDTTTSVQLSQAAYVDGTVTNASGSVNGAFVVADSENRTLFEQTDSQGEYNLTVPPGTTYRVTVFEQNQSATPVTVTPDDGSSVTADFSLQKNEIKHSSIEVLDPSGVDTANIGLSAGVQRGMMMVQVLNRSSPTRAGMPNEVEGLGVADDTTFEINITVTNYEPSSLLWGAKNVSWSVSENESITNGHDITIRTDAVNLQGINGHGTTIGPLMTKRPSDVQWPSGRDDRADIGWNSTVYFGLFDQSTAPPSIRDSYGGLTVTTNAQTFAPPRLTNGSLKVWVGGPHRTVAGNTHEGFYEATIPDSQLQEWGVDPANAKQELQVKYRGGDQNFEVTDLDDGVRISLDIHYSAGPVNVAPAPKTTSQSQPSSPSSRIRLRTETTVTTTDGTTTAHIDSISVRDSISIVSDGVAAGGVEVRETRLSFDMGTNSDNEITVSADASPPSAVSPLSDARALSYLTIDVRGNLEGRETDGTITFAVDEDSLTDAGSTVADVQAYHYNAEAGNWAAIETRRRNGTTFEATTDSFSTFAVGLTGSSAQQSTPEPTPVSTTATPEQTTELTPVSTPTTPEQTAESTPHSAAEQEPAVTETQTAEPQTTTTATTTPGNSGPGFGPVVVLLAVAVLTVRTIRHE